MQECQCHYQICSIRNQAHYFFNGKTRYVTRNVKVRSHFTILTQACLYSYRLSSLDVVCIVSVLLLSTKTLQQQIQHYQQRIFGPVHRCIHCQMSSNFSDKIDELIKYRWVLVVRNSIDTFWYCCVSIPYLGIDTWYCRWISDQNCQKKIN